MYSTTTSIALWIREISVPVESRRVRSHAPTIMSTITPQVNAMVALISTNPHCQ